MKTLEFFNLDLIFAIAFGEMELTKLQYWSLIGTVAIFVISFALSTIPLARNMKRGDKENN